MSTEDLLEELISAGVKAYRKLYRNSTEGRKLEKHEKTVIDNVEFNCWREYAVYKTAEFVAGIIPPSQVEVILDGNSSLITVTCDSGEQQEINRKLFLLLKEENII